MTDQIEVTVNASVWTFPSLNRAVCVVENPKSGRPTVIDLPVDEADP
jgi:hypothetical protein